MNNNELMKLIEKVAYKHDKWQVFLNFLELSAISIVNGFDLTNFKEREQRYVEIVSKYNAEEQGLFPKMLGELVNMMENSSSNMQVEDILGKMFCELKSNKNDKSQYFTPQSVANMMGELIGFNEYDIINKGFLEIYDSCCGSAVMSLGTANVMLSKKYNYRKQLLVLATDIDIKCVHMAYIQLSLYGIPAVVIHRDELLMKEFSRWYTPIYVLDGWGNKSHF